MNKRTAYVGALAVLAAFVGGGQAGAIAWPEAVSQLATERSNAQICVTALKRYGDEGQVSRGRLTYGAAKADFDGVITGLITALAEGGGPESLPSLQADVDRGASALKAFCKTAEDLMSAKTGEKGVLADMVKAAVEQLVQPISGGVAAIYNNYRSDKAATRLTIRTQLEAAKWPEFDDVKAVQ
jgi:hypothetical protein